MKPLVAKSNQTEIHLFKADLKFMDFHRLTFRYLESTPLTGETKTSLAVRIHDYVFPVQEAILKYSFGKSKQQPETYTEIASGLKEALRRAKISLAINDNQNELFIGYWKFLVSALYHDALYLKDEQLQNTIKQFEQNVMTLQTKK